MSILRADFRSFFICGFRLGVGLSDQGPGFAPTESELVEKPLALADADVDLIEGLQAMTQEFSAPERLGISYKSRLLPKILADGLESAFR